MTRRELIKKREEFKRQAIFRKRFKLMEEKFAAMIQENGWAAHYVSVDENHINCHTHGAMEKLGHLDLQIVLPVPAVSANHILKILMNRIKDGMKYQEGEMYLEALRNDHPDCPIYFKKFRETGRDVLRVILPDVNNLHPGQGCVPLFERQLDDLEKIEDKESV
jgi:hypothetical protein